jgi:predicted  nucleic acid-binding Zn-ribbon protein
MTDTPSNRLDRIEAILDTVAAQQQINTQAIAQLTTKLDNLSDNVNDLTSNVNSVLARDAVLNDVLLELRDSHEQHQRNFEEHQRTTNAALNQLGAILIQLTRIDPQN